MDHLTIAAELKNNRLLFKELLKDKKKEEYIWKPATDKWCLLQIVCHLRDEEKEDFRARTKHALETPAQPLPPTDPEGWVISRKYDQDNYGKTLAKFLRERKRSVKWLQSLSGPNLESAYVHPKYGEMTVKMFMTNWLAHDYLHIRQIIKLKYDYLKIQTGEELNYAGNW